MKIVKRSYIFIKGIPKKVLCLLLSYSFRYFWFLVLLLHFSKMSCKWIFFVIFSTENLLSFNSTHEILITNFCSRYCKNIHYIHYTQLTNRMRSKERNMANTLRNYYLKQFSSTFFSAKNNGSSCWHWKVQEFSCLPRKYQSCRLKW